MEAVWNKTVLHLIIKKVVNIYIAYEIGKSINTNDYLTLQNCLFGAVRLTINADIVKDKHSGYGIGFDRERFFFQLIMKSVEIW